VLSGMRGTLPYAVFWSILAAIVYSRSGPVDPARHASLSSLVALYFGAALSSGAVLGALRAWASTTFRFALMSIAVAVPFALCLALMVNDWRIADIDQFDLVFFLFLAIAFGPPFGFYLRSEARKREVRRTDA
jgi:hypothetical protein